MKVPIRMIARYHYPLCAHCHKDMFGQKIVVDNDRWSHDNDICYPNFRTQNVTSRKASKKIVPIEVQLSLF